MPFLDFLERPRVEKGQAVQGFRTGIKKIVV